MIDDVLVGGLRDSVTWTSFTNPDYFDVSAGYSCGTGCGTGQDFEAVGAARTLTIPAGSLPIELTIQLQVFAYNNGSYTGDYATNCLSRNIYAPGCNMHIRNSTGMINIFINP